MIGPGELVVKVVAMVGLLAATVIVNEVGSRYPRSSWQRIVTKATAGMLLAVLCAVALAAR